MLQTYLNNILLGGLIGLINWMFHLDQNSIYGYILISLMFLSFGARVIIAKNFPPIKAKSAPLLNAFFIAPVFLFAAFADFVVILASMILLAVAKSPDNNIYGFLLLIGVFGSIFTIFHEAKLTFKADSQPTPQWIHILSKITLYAYCAFGVSLIWIAFGNKVLELFKSEQLIDGLLYLFLFYFFAIIPFQRHAFLETMVKGKTVGHFFLSLILGFSFVAWSVFG